MQPLSKPNEFFDEGYLFLHPETYAYPGGPWQHYCDQGKDLGFTMGYPNDHQFNAVEYLDIYRDVKQMGLDPWKHYVRYGALEGRNNCVGLEKDKSNFFPDGYLFLNPDVRESNMDPLMHYVQFGKKEGRTPGTPTKLDFNAERYLKKYPKVIETGIDPWKHYVLQGFYEHYETQLSTL